MINSESNQSIEEPTLENTGKTKCTFYLNFIFCIDIYCMTSNQNSQFAKISKYHIHLKFFKEIFSLISKGNFFNTKMIQILYSVGCNLPDKKSQVSLHARLQSVYQWTIEPKAYPRGRGSINDQSWNSRDYFTSV